jgi:hypothetical protein
MKWTRNCTICSLFWAVDKIQGSTISSLKTWHFAVLALADIAKNQEKPAKRRLNR